MTCQTSEAGKRSQRGPRLSQAVPALGKKKRDVTSAEEVLKGVGAEGEGMGGAEG